MLLPLLRDKKLCNLYLLSVTVVMCISPTHYLLLQLFFLHIILLKISRLLNEEDEQLCWTAGGLRHPDELELSPHQWRDVLCSCLCLSLSMKCTGPLAPPAGGGVRRKVVSCCFFRLEMSYHQAFVTDAFLKVWLQGDTSVVHLRSLGPVVRVSLWGLLLHNYYYYYLKNLQEQVYMCRSVSSVTLGRCSSF